MRKITRLLWLILVAAACLAGLAGLFFFLPFNQLKPLVDALSRDGHLDSFTQGRYQSLAIFLPWVGLLLVLGGLLAIILAVFGLIFQLRGSRNFELDLTTKEKTA